MLLILSQDRGMKLLQTIDELVRDVRASLDISIDDYLVLKQRASEISVDETWNESQYVRSAIDEINERLQAEDKLRLEKIASSFSKAHRKFESEYNSYDSKTTSQKREELDSLARAYVELEPEKTKDRPILRYIGQLNERLEINADFNAIRKIAATLQKAGNRKKLRVLMKRRILNGSTLNLTRVISSYQRINFYEGVEEAQRLQTQFKIM